MLYDNYFSVSPPGTITMMVTSTALMASTLATSNYCCHQNNLHHNCDLPGMFLAHGSTTTSPPRLWTLETLELGVRSSPESWTGHHPHHDQHQNYLFISIILIIIVMIQIMIIVMMKRYFETQKRVNYIGDCSAGGTSDFRYYNYRQSSSSSSSSLGPGRPSAGRA